MTISLAGCGGASDAPPLAKVTGVVTLDGEPLTSGAVQFSPDGSKGTKGRLALGAIGADGRYELRTNAPGDGAQIGFHKISVSSYEVIPLDPNKPGYVPPQKSLIPVKYIEDKTSGLAAEIKGGAENVINFDLKSTP